MTSIIETLPVRTEDQLHLELDALGVAGFSGVIGRGDDVEAVYDPAPSAGDDAIIRAAILAHVPSDDLEVRLYDLVPGWTSAKYDAPLEIDYTRGLTSRLYKSFTDVYQGEIREVTFYEQATQDPSTGVVSYSIPVVRENFTYFRDPVGFARQRVQTITWILKNGTDHPDVKTRHKMYDGYETIVEGRRRRGNLADRMATQLSGWLAATQTQHASVQDRLQMGRDFLRHHKTSFDLFGDVSDHQIVLDVRADQEAGHTWLDSTWDGTQTVREWIDDQINIWGIP